MKVSKSLENGGILVKGTFTKIISQEGGFLSFLRPLITAGLPMRSVLTLLCQSVLIPLGLSAGMSVEDAAIQNKFYESGTTTSIISNEEMKDIMKIVKSLEESGLWIKELMKQLKMKQRNKKVDFFQCY